MKLEKFSIVKLEALQRSEDLIIYCHELAFSMAENIVH